MRTIAIGIALVVAVPVTAGAQQQNGPHAGYVYPAGGRRGTTVRVVVGGQFLTGVSGALVSGSGVEATAADYSRPLNGKEATELRDRLQELQKNGRDPTAQQEIVRLREQLGDTLRRNNNPPISERVTLDVNIGADATPGTRSLRLMTPLGVTNPIAFCVGQLPEFRETEVKSSPADSDLPVTIPAVVNGRIVPGDSDRIRFPLRQAPQYMPGDVDRYRFYARRGQQLVAVVSARDLMPYLADAVPGWFQATLALLDASGRELAYDDDYRFHPDPVIHCPIPADGEYILEIKDALYRGREDFVYRIVIGELPFVTSIFPLGGRLGTSTEVELDGWNLPVHKVVVDAKDRHEGVYPVQATGTRATGDGARQEERVASNAMPFKVDTLPEAFEREPNNTRKQAQPVVLPAIINGRIDAPGDWDTFSVTGRAGDEVVAEVYARRLESPLDSVLELVDGTGRRLAFNDDHEDKEAGLITHQADSYLTATLPAAGTYFLRLGDVQHKGGTEYAYRLRISGPRPDFDLVVTPSSINAGGNATVPITVHAMRKDGFGGDIVLALNDAPAGFALSGGVVPAGQNDVRLTLTAGAAQTSVPVMLRLEGRATIQGREVVRRARPADEMMQAFAYQHLVPADDLRVSVIGRGATRVPSRLAVAQPVTIQVGGSVHVRAAVPPGYLTFENVQFELTDAPDGITLGNLSLSPAGADFVLQADAAKAKPGLRGNLIVNVSGERVAPQGQQAPQVRRRVVLGTLPAVAFAVTP